MARPVSTLHPEPVKLIGTNRSRGARVTAIRNHANLIWGIAKLLRGDCNQADYGKGVLDDDFRARTTFLAMMVFDARYCGQQAEGVA
jgi:hypothetical protein